MEDIHQMLQHHNALPKGHRTRPYYFTTFGVSPQRICWEQTISSLGLSSFSHLQLRIILPGGTPQQSDGVSYKFNLLDISLVSVPDQPAGLTSSGPRQSGRVRDKSRYEEAIVQEALDEDGEPRRPRNARKRKHPSRDKTAKGAEGFSSDAGDEDFTSGSDSDHETSSTSSEESELETMIDNEEVCFGSYA
jgi:hypothetical protein